MMIAGGVSDRVITAVLGIYRPLEVRLSPQTTSLAAWKVSDPRCIAAVFMQQSHSSDPVPVGALGLLFSS